MNDANKGERDALAKFARDTLAQVKPGHVIIVGPAVASTWMVEDPRRDEKATNYMNVLAVKYTFMVCFLQKNH